MQRRSTSFAVFIRRLNMARKISGPSAVPTRDDRYIIMKEGEDPEAYYKRLAKVADQRLLRLERLSEKENYKGVKEFSYKGALHDIQIYTPGAHRFNTKMVTVKDAEGNDTGKVDMRILKERTMTVLDFLRAPTSTKYGIDQNFRNAIETTNKLYGTSFTWQEAANFFAKNQYESQFKQANGSPIAIRAIGKIQKLDDFVVRGIALDDDFTIAGPEKSAAIKLLSDRRRKYVGGREYTTETKIKILKLIDPDNEYDWMRKFTM